MSCGLCRRSFHRLASTASGSSPGPSAGRRFHKDWYSESLAAGDLIDSQTPVRGCAILKPRGYALWSGIRQDLDARIQALGAQNVCFPLLVPASFLQREAAHVAGFAAECAVVTHHRLVGDPLRPGAYAPDPAAALPEPYVVRPTSEAIVWDAFSRWVQSHRDLPLLVNQWANVVRWELRTRPFLRTSEFLWQEGHTAHASEQEAAELARAAQRMYAAHCTDFLAMPVLPGQKSASERFAGATHTLTCEALLPNGWALQAATAHQLGQGFAKAFGVSYDPPGGPPRLTPYGTSWGASTRLIGGAILQHGDDTGLLFPPALAPTNVVVVALLGAEAAAQQVHAMLTAAAAVATPAGSIPIRAALDLDTGTQPGKRFFDWERRGVPLRIEVGKREAEAGEVSLKDRLGYLAAQAAAAAAGGGGGRPGKGGRVSHSSLPDSGLLAFVQRALVGLQGAMLQRAVAAREGCLVRGGSYGDLVAHVASGGGQAGGGGEEGEGGGVQGVAKAFLLPWADDAAAEAQVKAATRYTLRCFPDAEQGLAEGQACSFSGKRATHMALFARAY